MPNAAEREDIGIIHPGEKANILIGSGRANLPKEIQAKLPRNPAGPYALRPQCLRSTCMKQGYCTTFPCAADIKYGTVWTEAQAHWINVAEGGEGIMSNNDKIVIAGDPNPNQSLRDGISSDSWFELLRPYEDGSGWDVIFDGPLDDFPTELDKCERGDVVTFDKDFSELFNGHTFIPIGNVITAENTGNSIPDEEHMIVMG